MQFSMSQPIKVSKISRLAGFYALLLIVFPNVAFLMLAWLTNTARPIVNLDYFIVALLLVMPIRLVRWIGILLFWLVVLFDSLMFIMQLFPFMDFSGALYLAPFILKAPLLYKLTCLVFLLYIIGIPVLLSKFSKKTNFFHVLLVCLPLTIIGYFTGHLQYHYRTLYNNNAFGRDNFYYVKSQFELYRINQADAFIQESGVAPVFSQLKFDRAANRLIQPYSRRILFITNESWGAT